MLDDAIANAPPAVGQLHELEEILQHRRNLRSGYGLPLRHTDNAVATMGKLEQSRACGEDLCQTSKTRIIGDACA
jgi:hypothetical protein